MERVNQYFKDRTESFDDYYPCRLQKDSDECILFHVHNWIQFFVSMYNDIISNKNESIIQLQEEVSITLN
jgi:putative transposase